MTVFVVLACILAPIVVLCAVSLFIIGSTFARPLQRLSTPLATLLALIAIFAFLLPEANESISAGAIALVSLVSCFSFLLFGHEISVCRRSVSDVFLAPRRRLSRPLFYLSICLLDLFGIILAGLTVGFSFLASSGAGYIVLCSLVLFTIPQILSRLDSYQALAFSRRAVTVCFSVAFLAFPLVAILSFLCAGGRLLTTGVLLSLAAGHLLYLASWHLYFIVRGRLKR